MWHVTGDMLHVTLETWHVTRDIWHMEGGEVFMFLAHSVWEWKLIEDLEEKGELTIYSMNDRFL